MRKFLFSLIVLFAGTYGFGQLNEGFDDITTLEPNGWTMTNQSNPVGTTNWFQGNDTVFPSHSGASTSYIGANFNNTSGAGTISNWLITPTQNVKDGDKLSFWTRVPDGSIWNDRLEVRMSTGTMTVPSGVNGVGSFTTVMLIINDGYNLSYPEVWTKFEATVSGVGSTPVAANFAFRYNVVNGGPSGTDSNYIGIDDVVVEAGGGGPFPSPYCEVDGLIYVEPITKVIFADINNSSSASTSAPRHEDFTSIVGHVNQGDTYSFAVEGNTNGNWENSFRVYIDWNQDGDFTDPGEYYYIGTITNSTGTDGQQAVADVAVPSDALSGNTRMRVIKKFLAGDPSPNDGCTGGSSFGQAEDYTLNVGGGVASPCDTKVVMDCGVTYTADLVPSAGQWVNYTGVSWNYTGSEQVFEFTAPSTGSYTFELSQGANDADFMLMDACSNTANNLLSGTGLGYWTGNSNETITLTGGTTYYIIADLYEYASGPTTVSIKVNCPGGSGFTCEDNKVPSGGLTNGYFFTSQLAVDIITDAAGFEVYGTKLNVFVDGGTNLNFSFQFFEGTSGVPGTFLESVNGTVADTEYVGNAFGYDVYTFSVVFDHPISFAGNSTYWMEVISDGFAWESTTADTFGSLLAINQGSGWALDDEEFVYELICEELGTSDLSTYDFAYWPNPVKDVLNITSQKAVKTVEAFNMAGQKVLSSNKVTNGQIDVNALTPGVYVFKAVLEGGQVETFKITKK